jgi:hypothetical protein
MRALPALLAVAVLCGTPALARDGKECHLTVGPGDVVKRTGDVVVEAGQVVANAVALDGTVRVKKGAVVKSALAVKGDVVVEDGAEVTETALSLGGAVKVKKGGVVKGTTLQLKEGGLRLKSDSGSKVSGDLVVDGESLSTKLLAGILGSLEGCAVEAQP